MNMKILAILLIITAALGTLAYQMTQSPPATTSEMNQRFFPDLMKNVNDVAKVTIQSKEAQFTLLRQTGGTWVMQEKHSFPAKTDKIRQLLLNAAELRILEQKTSNPELYSRIGVEGIETEGAKSVLLTLQKGENETLAKMLVGTEQNAKSDATQREIYVRKPEDKESWLVMGQLGIDKSLNAWLATDIANIEQNRLHQVIVTQPNGEVIRIYRDTLQEEFKLATMPAEAKISSPYQLTQYGMIMSNLTLEDVFLEKDTEFKPETTYQAVFTTFDGLEVTLTATLKDEKYYGKLAAKTVPALIPVPDKQPETEKSEQKTDDAKTETPTATNTDGLKKSAEVQQEVETYNTRWQGWVFLLPDYKLAPLAKKAADLYTIEKPEEKTQTNQTDVVPSVEQMLNSLGNPQTN